MLYSGSCLCKKVRFSISEKPIHTAHCHCEECRKSSATRHATQACFLRDKVVWHGDYQIYQYTGESGKAVEKWFCSECGSPIATWNENYNDIVAINLGVFDNIEGIEPDTVYFDSSSPYWGRVCGDLQRYATKPK